MSWRAFDVKCGTCGHVWEELENVKPTTDLSVFCYVCTNCEDGVGTYIISAPEVRTDSNSKSFVDGTRRPGFKELKESLDIKAALSDLPPDQRSKARKEIIKLEGSK